MGGETIRSGQRPSRSGVIFAIMLALGLGLGGGSVTAQDKLAADNGGSGRAGANGGAVALGEIQPGANVGTAISRGDTGGGTVNGGAAVTAADLGVESDGGTAVSDAGGGEENLAAVIAARPSTGPDGNGKSNGNDDDDSLGTDDQVCIMRGQFADCVSGSCEQMDGQLVCEAEDCNSVGIQGQCQLAANCNVVANPCVLASCAPENVVIACRLLET